MIFCSAECNNFECKRHHTKFNHKATPPITYADFTKQCKKSGKFVEFIEDKEKGND